MAIVKVSTQRKEVITYEEEEVITLTLSRDEAEALKSLVGQCQSRGPCTPIFDALHDAEIVTSYRVKDAHGSYIPAIALTKKV
jgi:hypothetical protein